MLKCKIIWIEKTYLLSLATNSNEKICSLLIEYCDSERLTATPTTERVQFFNCLTLVGYHSSLASASTEEG